MELLSAFKGVAVHDGWASCCEYVCTHALCNAHHLRELVYLEETAQQPWARKMIDFLCDAKKETDAAKRALRTVSRKRLARLRHRYGAILAEGERDNSPSTQRPRRSGRVKQSLAVNLLIRLRQHAQDVLGFLADPRVPFDNNQAERDIRMPKLKQKTSGCFRTVAGTDSFAIIRSYLATLRKQGRSVFDAPNCVFHDKIPDPIAA